MAGADRPRARPRSSSNDCASGLRGYRPRLRLPWEGPPCAAAPRYRPECSTAGAADRAAAPDRCGSLRAVVDRRASSTAHRLRARRGRSDRKDRLTTSPYSRASRRPPIEAAGELHRMSRTRIFGSLPASSPGMCIVRPYPIPTAVAGEAQTFPTMSAARRRAVASRSSVGSPAAPSRRTVMSSSSYLGMLGFQFFSKSPNAAPEAG